MEYSYFIKKHLKFIQDNGYLIYPDGDQIYKKIGTFEVLISDFTGNKLLFFYRMVLVEVWIKDSFTDIIQYKKFYKGDIFYPKMEKIDREINKEVTKLEKLRAENKLITD